MNPAWIIQKKRDGIALSADEIKFFIRGISSGQVAEYQATAWLMAVFFRGMNLDEVVALTEAMLESGIRYDLSHIAGVKADKHSTGGVGDKVSLVLAPLAAACGLKVPMMSGRGLGHSGGTLDKLESIAGFEVKLELSRFEKILSQLGCAMIGQSDQIAPADKKLYSLRDVTATVECIPLIVASILSKKLAEGTDVLVLDVKVGSGAFMKTTSEARKLAKLLTQVGTQMGLKCRAILTDMSQPLGSAVGNSLEVIESIQILRNEKSPDSASDVRELTIQLVAHMLELSGLVKNLTQGRKLALDRLTDGSAWKIFQDIVRLQGGDLKMIEHPSRLPIATQILTWKALKKGYITEMDTEALGRLLVELGGGRKQASDVVDPGVGLIFHRKLGAKVSLGEKLVTVYAAEKTKNSELRELEQRFQAAVKISAARKAAPKLILEILSK